MLIWKNFGGLLFLGSWGAESMAPMLVLHGHHWLMSRAIAKPRHHRCVWIGSTDSASSSSTTAATTTMKMSKTRTRTTTAIRRAGLPKRTARKAEHSVPRPTAKPPEVRSPMMATEMIRWPAVPNWPIPWTLATPPTPAKWLESPSVSGGRLRPRKSSQTIQSLVSFSNYSIPRQLANLFKSQAMSWTS